MRKKSYKAWTTELVENLSVYMDLAGWNILIQWSEESNEADGVETYATIRVNSVYQTATFTFMKASKQDFDEGTTDRLVQAAVHELVHIFLDPFQDAMQPFLSVSTAPEFMNKIEQQTQKLTMVLLKNLPPKLIPPR